MGDILAYSENDMCSLDGKECAIIIPCYAELLSNNERIAFEQCLKVLSKYDIYIMAPKGLASECFSRVKKVFYYDAKVFSSRDEYSRFMLSKNFYLDFADYKYVLIYQLDAFVFDDKLEYFCDLDYDYIGAPWPFGQTVHSEFGSKVLYVGNGGFSLRKTKTFIEWIDRNNKEIAQMYNRVTKSEDLIISYIQDMNIAPINIAFEFAVETMIQETDRALNGELPFGAHSVMRYDYYWWSQKVKGYGYTPDFVQEKSINIDLLRKEACIFEHSDADNVLKKVMRELFPQSGNEICIWGTGYFGKKMLALCERIDIKVSYFIENCDTRKEFLEYIVVPAKEIDFCMMSNLVIAVMDSKMIEKQVYEQGINECSFITYSDIINELYRIISE